MLGSIPTAFIILKKIKGKDITREGSGSAGAYNSYDITKSKLIAVVVLVIDFGKGFLSVLIPFLIFPGEFIYPALALLFAVFAHCFNPWTSFKGGRGLATAAGGASLLFPYLLVVWGALWVIFYVMRKDILFANITATVFSLLLVYNTPDIAVKYVNPQPESISLVMLISTSVLMIIFIKHLDPLKEIFNSNKERMLKK